MLRRLPNVMKFRLGRCELTKVLFQLEDGALTETVFTQAIGSGSRGPNLATGTSSGSGCRNSNGSVGAGKRSLSSMSEAATEPLERQVPTLAGGGTLPLTEVPIRNTVCVSSQIGCRRLCEHCYSGGRFKRDLTTTEIVGQVAAFAVDHEIGHIVFHGTGEPLDNPSVCHAAHFLSTSFHRLSCTCDGVECGTQEAQSAVMPSICLSTAGSVSGIRSLAEVASERVSLMLSIMPDMQRNEPLDDILVSSDDFAQRTGRRVALSHTMIEGLDTDAYIDKLLDVMKNRKDTHALQLVQYHANSDTLPPGAGTARPSSADSIRHCIARLKEEGCRVGFGQYCEYPSALVV